MGSITLSKEQLNVLELVYKGFTNKQIANEFGIQYGSAKVTVTRTFHHIGVSNRWAAMVWYRGYLERENRTKKIPVIHVLNSYGIL